MIYEGTLYTVSAPSGAGKTSLVRALVESTKGVCVSVSHTTRDQRAGEVDGVDYHFVDSEVFSSMVAQGDFLEYAQVFKHSYGTSGAWVQETRANGQDVVLEIDWQGAQQVRKKVPDAVSIFILPPSQEALRDRLTGRARDDQNVIEMRMSEAKSEMSHYGEAQYLVINEEFSVALEEFRSIILSNRLKLEKQQRKHEAILSRLLC